MVESLMCMSIHTTIADIAIGLGAELDECVFSWSL